MKMEEKFTKFKSTEAKESIVLWIRLLILWWIRDCTTPWPNQLKTSRLLWVALYAWARDLQVFLCLFHITASAILTMKALPGSPKNGISTPPSTLLEIFCAAVRISHTISNRSKVTTSDKYAHRTQFSDLYEPIAVNRILVAKYLFLWFANLWFGNWKFSAFATLRRSKKVTMLRFKSFDRFL